jgi:hypothetical protein
VAAALTDRAFFVRDGDVFTPTGLGKSPWDATKQGGGPICGLSAQLLAGVPAAVPMLPQRVVVDIYGQVPMAPLTASTRLLRDGRRVRLVEATLAADGRTYARATMLQTRTEGGEDRNVALTRPFPDGAGTLSRVVAESVRVAGQDGEPGPGAIWLRVITPLVAGAPIDPLGSLAMVADWGTTVSAPASTRDWTFASLDVSLHLLRMPRDPWWLLDGASEMAGNGTGIASMRLGDRTGMFGTVHQSFILERRHKAKND